MSLDTVSEFDKLLKSSELLFGLGKQSQTRHHNRTKADMVDFTQVYRGHWCPFCLDHVRSLKDIEKQIHDAGGQTVLITSERKEHLEKVRSATDYTGPVIVDDENVLVKELKERKVADIAISSMTMRRYDHGMAQPAIFVLKQDGTVLYTWAIVPGLVSGCHGRDVCVSVRLI